MNDVKTILLIGRTGNGKSTLANVITRTDKFTESGFAVSETKKVADYEFEYEEGMKYRIVDTVGVGDTSMTIDRVLRKLALMGYSVKDGVSRILFVTDGKLAEEAKSTYNFLREVVFNDDIAKYTTVVRTRFDNFRKEKECEEDRKRMIENSEGLRKLIGECKNIIYVDNPPVDAGDEEEKISRRKRREDSRKILLEHLKSVCNDGDTYRPINLVALGSEIGKYMVKKEGLKEKMNNKPEEMPEENSSIKSTTTAIGKKVVTQGVEVAKNIKEQSDNKLLNRKITKRMIKHIGNIDLRLKESIEKEIKQLEKDNKKEKPAK